MKSDQGHTAQTGTVGRIRTSYDQLFPTQWFRSGSSQALVHSNGGAQRGFPPGLGASPSPLGGAGKQLQQDYSGPWEMTTARSA